MLKLTRHHDHRYTAFDGRLYLERRPNLSPYWQVRVSYDGRQATRTTKCADLPGAQKFAERFWIDFQYQRHNGLPIATQRTLATAYRDFMKWQRQLIESGESTPEKCERYSYTWNNIQPKLGNTPIDSINFDRLREFKQWRMARAKPRKLTGKTLRGDFSLIRMVLNHAISRGWLKMLPQFPSQPVDHVSPDWFTVEEVAHLLKVAKQRCEAVKHHPHHYFERQELENFIWLMLDSCIRVDECLNLRWKDCVEAPENETLNYTRDQTVLLRIPDGKVGYRNALGTGRAVLALMGLRDMNPDAKPEDRLFKTGHHQAFAKLLDAAGLRRDAKGRLRNQKTLRHTSIMLRCLTHRHLNTAELSRVSGTSMVSLEKYYLRHLTSAHVQQRIIENAPLRPDLPGEKRS